MLTIYVRVAFVGVFCLKYAESAEFALKEGLKQGQQLNDDKISIISHPVRLSLPRYMSQQPKRFKMMVPLTSNNHPSVGQEFGGEGSPIELPGSNRFQIRGLEDLQQEDQSQLSADSRMASTEATTTKEPVTPDYIYVKESRIENLQILKNIPVLRQVIKKISTKTGAPLSEATITTRLNKNEAFPETETVIGFSPMQSNKQPNSIGFGMSGMGMNGLQQPPFNGFSMGNGFGNSFTGRFGNGFSNGFGNEFGSGFGGGSNPGLNMALFGSPMFNPTSLMMSNQMGLNNPMSSFQRMSSQNNMLSTILKTSHNQNENQSGKTRITLGPAQIAALTKSISGPRPQ